MDSPFAISLAHLDHICLRSPNPEALASFYGHTMGMNVEPQADSFLCHNEGRRLVISKGVANTMAYSAFQFETEESLVELKENLEKRCVEIHPSPSPLFSTEAFAVSDPDGMLSVFGHNYAFELDVETDETHLLGRLQHYAIATTEIEQSLHFYTHNLGFIVSDRVLDENDNLRAVFLRSDHEHHTLAIFLAEKSRPDHHCYEAGDWALIRDWADHMANSNVPLKWGPGRHGPGNNLFFMIHDPDGNWVEISAELDVLNSDQEAGIWPHTEKTLNSWGQAFLRS